VILWVRLGIGFYSLLFALLGGRDVSQVQTGFLGRRAVFLITYHLLGHPAVCPLVLHSTPPPMVALTAVRDRDYEVYSVIASCWQGAMKGPAASGLTTRGVIKETEVVGHFHLQQKHL
jgi:hypothetical protein